MAQRLERFIGLYALFTRTPTRYSSLPFSSFSTLVESSHTKLPHNLINHSISNLDETSVLNQLSDLLPIKPKQTSNHSTQKQIHQYLSPAEKLRGIFLQKLKGRAAIESALASVNIYLNIEIVAQVVNRGNLGGEAMVSFFNWAIKQPAVPADVRSYQIIIKALGRRKYFDFMEVVLREMIGKGIEFDLETLYIVMDSFVKARLISKAVKLFGNLEEFGLRSDTESLNVLLECLCKRSHVGSANSVLSSMRGKIEFGRKTFNIIICGWSKLGRVDEAERFIKEMVGCGYAPDCLTFSYLLECLGRAGRIGHALEIFGKMSELGCAPDTVAYNAMISNFISIGELDECMKYYRDMTTKSSLPDINTYENLINAFLKTRRVADALELFDEMLDNDIIPNTGIITSFLEPLCSFGPPHAATLIYQKARKAGCEISLKAYKLLLMRLSRFGKCGMVLQLWDEMQSSGYASDMEVYEYVVNGLCNIGQLENAAVVMEEALRNGFCPGKIIYSKLNNKLLNVNKVERAYKLFLKVKEARTRENAWRFWRSNGWHY